MMPFERYPKRGRQLLGPLPKNAGGARRGYGKRVRDNCGFSCAYCGRDLQKSYKSWLDFQVDHVVPQCAAKQGFREEWIKDASNCVTCCAACNTFLNGFRVKDTPPKSLAAFYDIRDRVFSQKREKARKRHAEERAYWKENVRE